MQKEIEQTIEVQPVIDESISIEIKDQGLPKGHELPELGSANVETSWFSISIDTGNGILDAVTLLTGLTIIMWFLHLINKDK